MGTKPSICISGMVAVGKSTLAKHLANESGYALVTESSLGLDYLERLFRDPNRWGLEAQIAFLLGKAAAIYERSGVGSYVLDRSVEEDAEVFFDYFREEHSLDTLSVRTYTSLFALLQKVLPLPDIWILCDIDYPTVKARIANRDKFNAYVDGYVDSIFMRYEQFFARKRGQPNTYTINSSEHDWTDKSCARVIAEDVRLLVAAFPEKAPGLSILAHHK